MKKTSKYHFIVSLAFATAVLILSLFGCQNTGPSYESQLLKDTSLYAPGQATEFAVEAPPLTEGIFPCSECHKEIEPNPIRRNLDWHEEITSIFNHDSENRWCLDCHDLQNRDSLKLASGKLLSFEESYKLCGQCHGDKLRDWKVGVHGKRTGQWNGKKEYLLCVHCHNPHSPRFQELTPEPPPVRQDEIGEVKQTDKIVQDENDR